MKLNLHEENTFCVALDSRWPAMEERLKRLAIPCARWEASLPHQLEGSFLSYLTPHQRACAQSHVRLWQEMLRRDLEYAFIMEDDVMFHHDWRAMLETWEVNDPEWDLILLNAAERVEPEESWVACKNQYLTGGYIISKKGVRWILEKFQEAWGASDWMTWTLQDQGHSYARFPWPMVQEGKDSTIGSNFEANWSKVLRLLGEESLALYS